MSLVGCKAKPAARAGFSFSAPKWNVIEPDARGVTSFVQCTEITITYSAPGIKCKSLPLDQQIPEAMIKTMTVDEQVSVLRQASVKATKSKASALRFLQGAGIVINVVAHTKRTGAAKKKK